jgi:signal transduction histidine kinase
MQLSTTLVSRFTIGYMLLASVWWAFQLWSENDRLFKVERELVERSFADRQGDAGYATFEKSAAFLSIRHRWEKRRRMVLAEGFFFIGCLLLGFRLINRSLSREIDLTRQRRNFMLSVTHELKSPLASIRLVLETLGMHNLSKPQQDRLGKNGMHDVDRLQNLVESLLLAARLEDNWRPAYESIQIADIARDCIAGLQARFPAANFRVRVPEKLPRVQADKAGITSVILNLLENAAKYAGKAPEITFSAELTTDQQVRLSIADDGTGIPESERKAIFNKFYRIGNEETRRTTGTGLGLYIVQQVVKAHHGRLFISANKPRGTVFTVII